MNIRAFYVPELLLYGQFDCKAITPKMDIKVIPRITPGNILYRLR